MVSTLHIFFHCHEGGDPFPLKSTSTVYGDNLNATHNQKISSYDFCQFPSRSSFKECFGGPGCRVNSVGMGPKAKRLLDFLLIQ